MAQQAVELSGNYAALNQTTVGMSCEVKLNMQILLEYLKVLQMFVSWLIPTIMERVFDYSCLEVHVQSSLDIMLLFHFYPKKLAL